MIKILERINKLNEVFYLSNYEKNSRDVALDVTICNQILLPILKPNDV